MGLTGRFVGKALFYEPVRDQDEISTFDFEGITQNLRQFIYSRALRNMKPTLKLI